MASKRTNELASEANSQQKGKEGSSWVHDGGAVRSTRRAWLPNGEERAGLVPLLRGEGVNSRQVSDGVVLARRPPLRLGHDRTGAGDAGQMGECD